MSRELMHWLPSSLRLPLYRRSFRLPAPSVAGVEIRLAESQDDYEQLFRLLYDSYLEEGFTEQNATGLRVTPYHLLPSTSTFVATYKSRVIGTMAVIRDNPFGLPMDKVFDLGSFRSRGERLGEISAFAIAREFRGKGGALMFEMIRMMWLHSLIHHRLDQFVIAVNPEREDIYRSLYLFQPIPGVWRVGKYAFASQAPAIGLSAPVLQSPLLFSSVYEGTERNRDLYRYMFESNIRTDLKRHKQPYYQLFSRSFEETNLLRYFMCERSAVWEQMTLEERIRMNWAHQSARGAEKKRYDVRFPAYAFPQVNAVIQDISASGLKIIEPADASSLNFPQTCDRFELKVEMGSGIKSRVVAQRVWQNGVRSGLIVVDADQAWFDFFAYQAKLSSSRAAA